jgi:hypothetical protein
MANQPLRRTQHGGMALVIGAQLNHCPGETGAEVEKSIRVGASVTVDRLVGIHEDADRILRGHKLRDKAGLQGVEILRFVNEHMGVAGLVEDPPFLGADQEVSGVDEQILKIHPATEVWTYL